MTLVRWDWYRPGQNNDFDLVELGIGLGDIKDVCCMGLHVALDQRMTVFVEVGSRLRSLTVLAWVRFNTCWMRWGTLSGQNNDWNRVSLAADAC
jgi:hypothetical protein